MDITQAMKIVTSLPVSEAIAKIVLAVAQKVERGEDLNATEQVVLMAAVSGISGH